MSFLLSIPGSNATYSLMNAKWCDDRNRMSMVLMTAELQFTKLTLSIAALFTNLRYKNHKLLEAAGSNDNIHGKTNL
jgi:hypothetical protein